MYTLLQCERKRAIVCLCRCVSLLCATSSSPGPILLPLRWAFSNLWWIYFFSLAAQCMHAFVCVRVCSTIDQCIGLFGFTYAIQPLTSPIDRNMFDPVGITCNETGEIFDVICNLLRYIRTNHATFSVFNRFYLNVRLLVSILNCV